MLTFIVHLDIICPSGNPLNLLGKAPLVEPAIHPILAGLVGAANRAGFRYDARAVRPVQKESGKAYPVFRNGTPISAIS